MTQCFRSLPSTALEKTKSSRIQLRSESRQVAEILGFSMNMKYYWTIPSHPPGREKRCPTRCFDSRQAGGARSLEPELDVIESPSMASKSEARSRLEQPGPKLDQSYNCGPPGDRPSNAESIFSWRALPRGGIGAAKWPFRPPSGKVVRARSIRRSLASRRIPARNELAGCNNPFAAPRTARSTLIQRFVEAGCNKGFNPKHNAEFQILDCHS